MAPKKIDFDEQTELSAGPNALVSTRQRPRLRIRFTDGAGNHDVALPERCVIGSASTCDVVVRDPQVSRIHAEIEQRDDGVWLRDLGSRNGSWVAGVFVSAARLPPSADVRVGSTTLCIEPTEETDSVPLWPGETFGPLVGRSASMRQLFARLASVAATHSTVLVHGETGTGKELVARAIHDASPREGGPFIVVDCGALAESLLESELFGHARGAFTGAIAARAGALESADGGTVFLDEVGELPLSMQPRLLRAIESRSVRRVGESNYRSVDVRFVSATHRDLRTMVNAGAFREDLYFRLAVIPVTVPPLRERIDDLRPLVEHFSRGAPRVDFDENVLRELSGRPWLGNVRELRNFVERARALGVREALRVDREGSSETLSTSGPPAAGAGSIVGSGVTTPPLVPSETSGRGFAFTLDESFKDIRDRMLDDLERRYVQGLIERHRGNVTAVAQAAGLNRGYVHRLIKKHGL